MDPGPKKNLDRNSLLNQTVRAYNRKARKSSVRVRIGERIYPTIALAQFAEGTSITTLRRLVKEGKKFKGKEIEIYDNVKITDKPKKLQ